MKSLLLSAIALLICCNAQSSYAQLDALLQPFTAKSGLKLAEKSADSSITSPKLLGVFSLGDTSAALQLPIKVAFDIKDGKAKAWLYFLSGKSRKTSDDTVVSAGIVKVALFGFQVLPFDASSLAPMGSFTDATLPDNWIDSDAMSAKIRDDNAYKVFSAAFPEKKPFLIPLSIAILPRYFTAGSPLWQLNFGGSPMGGGNGTILNCEVHAVTGETHCEEIALSTNDIIALDSKSYFRPNPASNEIRFAIPAILKGNVLNISIFDAVGLLQFTSQIETAGAETIVLPLDKLISGAYHLICSANGHSIASEFAVMK